MVETMTEQLGERMSILLARKSWKGAEKRKRSNYVRRHNKQLFKKSWDCSGGKIRRLELGKTIFSKPVETTDVSGTPIRVRTVDARSYRKWLTNPTITSREKILDKLGKRDRMSPKVTNVTRFNVLGNDVDEAAAENLSPGSLKRRRLDFGSEQRRYFPSAEPSRDTHGSSISKNGRESISRPEVEISEADNRNDWAESHVKTKIDDEHNACDGCTLGGKLLCCAGRECKRKYHPSCLDPPFNTTPPGVWHCLDCVKKKIKSGVHSVSKGVESICDVREVVLDHEEMQKQKEYLVKYQGLAHFHNQWIPEMVLPLEAAKLVAKFNGRNQVKKWRKEWTVPERLIHKRLLPSDECYNINSDCHCSWLVKWTGLGYDHATWELEGSSLLTSCQAMKLIKDYESRHETAEGISSFSQADKDRKAEFSSLSELSFGDSTRVKNCYLSYVNKLREYWHKGQNAIIVDDQERVVKVIFFILSLQQVVRKPFLIVSTPHALSVWEAELLHVAPSTNFIVYKGSKDTRASIRSLEFYNKIGQILFQVLLCTPDIVFEDLEVLKCIQWEAIIVDECQESESTRYFKKFKMLDAGMRLLVSSHIKDCSSDYLVMLSLLDSGLDGLGSGKTEVQPMSINKLKDRLASYTAYDCKSSVIRFVEYWVPVQLSNVQLEQYCAILLSNSRLLCSSVKTDTANTLREVIISTRKCCDHPYLLDRSLRSMLQNGRTIEECLDAEIQVSGKLLLLEKMLLEIRSRNLRAMVIFQPIGGSGLDSAGDILEDFLCQKFGHNCYIRIDGNSGLYAHSKKQSALNTFNAKKSENFVFLIENRACLSSIKLSLVDVVILFDSDLDPQNDLRALHRVSITSRSEELRVFRLYSCCTIEEKSLILAKEGAPIENSIASLSRSVSHTLLSWGASHLFRKLDDLHGCMASVPGSTIFSNQSFLDDVLLEFSAELPLSSEANNPSSYSFISKVEQNVRGYKAHALLAGEKEALAINGGKPGFLLWKKLLERKQYKWLFLSDSSSKIRRKVKCADDSLKESEFGYSEGRKKSQKVVNERIDHLVLKSRLKHTRKPSTDKKGGSCRSNFTAARSATNDSGRVLESEVRSMPRSTQKSSLLLPKILHLSDVLKLSEDTKNIIGFFLEYLDRDYNYEWKTNSSLQAFQISVCWVAVSFLKQEIDHKESLVIAKLQLDFVCEEGEANYIYSELQNLEEGFKCYLKNVEPADLEVGEMMTRADEAKISERTACYQQDLEEGEAQLSSNNSRKSKTLPSDQAGRDLQKCFESRCLSDKLAGLEEAERPMSSNCAMNSRSNTLCGKYLEEEVMSMSSDHGKRSKRSISVEQECEGELPNSSANQILSAQLMTSEDGVTPVGTSDEFANYSKVASCDWQDLEEGEIPPDSNGTNNSKMVTPVLQDLEEGEIPIESERHSISDRVVNSEEGEIAISFQSALTLEQELGSTTLSGSFKVKMDDSSCQIELHEKNLKTSESAPRIVEEQLEASITLQLEKTLDKPIASLESLHLSDTELKVDNMLPSEAKGVHIDSKDANLTFSSPTNQNHCVTLPTMPSEIPVIAPHAKEFCDLISGTETIIVEFDTECNTMEETIAKKVADSCTNQIGEVSSSTLGPELGFLLPVSVVKQSPAESIHIAETIIVGSKTDCDTMEATITKKVADSCSKKTGEVSSSTLGPELGFSPPVPVVEQSPAENEHIAETIIVGLNTECDTMEATITKKVAGSCSNKTGEVNSSSLGPEHCFPASVPVVTQSPVEKVHIIESSMKHSGALQTQPNEVAFVDDTDDQQAPSDEVVFIGNDIMPTQNKPMTSASRSDAAQDSRTVTPVDHESHSLECTVTHSSLVHQDMNAVQGESCPVQQLPISTVPLTAEQRLPVEPQFIGGQGYQSGQMQSSQETQIPRHLSFEDSTESCSPCTAHIPPQPVASIREGGNETFVQDARSRINVQDFWNAANHLRSPNDHLFDSPVRPEIPEHTSSDPLLIEMQRIANDAEKDDKAHQDMVLRLTSERDEEIRKVLQKYGPLIQGAEIARQQRKKEHRANLLKVYAHKFLAQVMTMDANGHMADLAQGKGKASVPSVDRLIQLSAQQNAQMSVSGHEQYQPGPPMAPPAELISSRSSVCAPTIHARPCSSPITSVPRNLQNGNEQNAQMPALRREQYQANLPMAPPAELMSHPSVYAPAIHGSPTMTCMPRNLQIGNELRALSPSPAPHLLQAAFRSHSSALAPNHPVINNWTPSQMTHQPALRQFAGMNGATRY